LISDRKKYRRRFEKWIASTDILKLSTVDFQWIYPEAEFERLLQTWFDLGVSLCILTRGEKDPQAFTNTGISSSGHTPHIEVADTVGAGDTFFAAVLAFLYENRLMQKGSLGDISAKQLSACLAFASQAAAINCSRTGADPPHREEMEVYFG
jgi:fructokinase